MTKIGIDCCELESTNPSSLGIILLRLLPKFVDSYEVHLFGYHFTGALKEFVKISPKAIVHLYNKKRKAGFGLIFYQRWISKTMNRNSIKMLFQINQYLLWKRNFYGIVVVHDLYLFERRVGTEKINRIKLFFIKQLYNRSLNNADSIITVSHFTRSRLNYFFPKFQNKIKVIYNGVDSIESITNDNIMHKLRLVDKKYYLFLGRLSYWKGTDLLLEAFQRLSWSDNNDRVLVLAGKDEIGIKKIYNSMIEQGKLILTGYLTEQEKYTIMKNASCFIYPSRYDGFGLPPLEAINQSTPILVSNIDVIKEITKNKAIYFSLNANDIVDKVLYFENLSELTKKEYVASLQEIVHALTWDNFFEELQGSISEKKSILGD